MSKTFQERYWEKFSPSGEYTTVLKIFLSCLQRNKTAMWCFTITASLQSGTAKCNQDRCSGLPPEITGVQRQPGAASHYTAQWKLSSAENTDFADSCAQTSSSASCQICSIFKKSETFTNSSLSHLVFSWEELRTMDLCWDCVIKTFLKAVKSSNPKRNLL